MTLDQAIDIAIVRMIAYYNFNGEMSDGGIHPRVSDLKQFLKKNIVTGQELHNFLKRVKDGCEWFPKHTDLAAIYNGMKTLEQQDTGINLLAYAENDGVSAGPIEAHKAATVEDVIAANRTMSAKSLLKTYGYRLCAAAWFRIGENMEVDEYDFFIRHVRRGKFDVAFSVPTKFELEVAA